MSYERITNDPQFDGKVRNTHEVRYHIARGFTVDSDIVIDACCGVGYGKEILEKEQFLTYLGIDKNPPAENDWFIKMDFEKNSLTMEHDVFIGLEAIEHLDNEGVANFVKLAKQAKKFIIISTPIVPNNNEYHKQQFKAEEIIDLFCDDNWILYGQLNQLEKYGIFIFKRSDNGNSKSTH